MAPKQHIPLVIFSLLFLYLTQLPWGSCASSSITSQHQEYEKWVMWNVQNHQWRKMNDNPRHVGDHASNSKAVVPRSVTSNTRVLDVKLERAERNKTKIVVDQTGNGDYKTITEAIDSIALHNSRRVILEIKPGVYREKIHIPRTKGFITMVGNSSHPPTITGNDTASVAGGDGTPLRTFQTATVAVDADYFVALNIIFETPSMITKAFITSTTASSKAPLTSSLVMLDPSMRTVYYGEYKCSGPGSNMTGRVPWARALTDQEAEPFIGPYFVESDTWLLSPST
ncbi:hypothetical protein Cgig2_020551 [Carnegiea gigantea]|uniref:pectinesterase n=1 Tax=Carnegiea gigantea TaxID=171969 RepID=A0A9Q1Q5Q9_9CARY|nr:hypothetical protein Cgig2_020551 [Carnegiea gigantea]